jgi:hypothetical protein
VFLRLWFAERDTQVETATVVEQLHDVRARDGRLRGVYEGRRVRVEVDDYGGDGTGGHGFCSI